MCWFYIWNHRYASPLLDIVDSERKLKGRFYRTSCRRVVCELGELYLKDLSSLPVPQPLSRMVLVDNNPVSFLVQPCNGIPVVSWYDNNNDVVLKEVFDILVDISKLDDVRTKLDGMFGLKMELKALRSTVGLKNQFEVCLSNKWKHKSVWPCRWKIISYLGGICYFSFDSKCINARHLLLLIFYSASIFKCPSWLYVLLFHTCMY